MLYEATCVSAKPASRTTQSIRYWMQWRFEQQQQQQQQQQQLHAIVSCTIAAGVSEGGVQRGSYLSKHALNQDPSLQTATIYRTYNSMTSS